MSANTINCVGVFATFLTASNMAFTLPDALIGAAKIAADNIRPMVSSMLTMPPRFTSLSTIEMPVSMETPLLIALSISIGFAPCVTIPIIKATTIPAPNVGIAGFFIRTNTSTTIGGSRVKRFKLKEASSPARISSYSAPDIAPSLNLKPNTKTVLTKRPSPEQSNRTYA